MGTQQEIQTAGKSHHCAFYGTGQTVEHSLPQQVLLRLSGGVQGIRAAGVSDAVSVPAAGGGMRVCPDSVLHGVSHQAPWQIVKVVRQNSIEIIPQAVCRHGLLIEQIFLILKYNKEGCGYN